MLWAGVLKIKIMSKLVREVSDLANEVIEEQWSVTPFEALQIAVKIQHNRVLEDAFMLGLQAPSALEAIAMELGASKDGSSIKNALYNLKQD
jgi:hypothetical protein